MGPLLNGVEAVVTLGKAETLNVFLASEFGSKANRQEPQALETEGKAGISGMYPWGWRIRDYLSKLGIHRSINSDVMPPKVMRELVDVIVTPILKIFDQLW